MKSEKSLPKGQNSLRPTLFAINSITVEEIKLEENDSVIPSAQEKFGIVSIVLVEIFGY